MISANKPSQTTLPGDFIVEYGAAIIERAERFVACQNKDFLEALIKYYKFYVTHQKTDIIVSELFKMLEEMSM